MHVKDLELLKLIQNHFGGVGLIVKQAERLVSYQVSSVKDISSVIIPHFDKYPLITKKMEDFILFREAVDIVKKGEHLYSVGLQKIVNIRASINLGLPYVLKEAFPGTVPVERPIFHFIHNIDPY